jgi:ABC-type multidrug transport system ATPase subunit
MDEYSNQIAYVMQDDILLATFTPTEAFKFSADMRLKDLSEDEKMEKVNSLIKLLGLEKCKDTKVGNAMIRGISGGERKRTSIGVELLTNPSILFLDEPTTGLDSVTSLNVIELLKNLS